MLGNKCAKLKIGHPLLQNVVITHDVMKRARVCAQPMKGSRDDMC